MNALYRVMIYSYAVRRCIFAERRRAGGGQREEDSSVFQLSAGSEQGEVTLVLSRRPVVCQHVSGQDDGLETPELLATNQNMMSKVVWMFVP